MKKILFILVFFFAATPVFGQEIGVDINTSPAEIISETSATLYGYLISPQNILEQNYDSKMKQVGFAFATSEANLDSLPCSIIQNDSSWLIPGTGAYGGYIKYGQGNNFSLQRNDFQSGTTYYFRACGKLDNGTSLFGFTEQFTTPSEQNMEEIDIKTLPLSTESYGIEVNPGYNFGFLELEILTPFVQKSGFAIATSDSENAVNGVNQVSIPSGGGLGLNSYDLGPCIYDYEENHAVGSRYNSMKSDLKPEVTYFYQACAESINGETEARGDVIQFTTLVQPNNTIEGCSVNTFQMSQLDDYEVDDANTTIQMNVSGCNNGLEIRPIGRIGSNPSNNVQARIDKSNGDSLGLVKPNISGDIHIKLQSDEAGCSGQSSHEDLWGDECIYIFDIAYENEVIFTTNKSPNQSGSLVPTDVADDGELLPNIIEQMANQNIALIGECDGGCDEGALFDSDADNWDFKELFEGSLVTNTSCDLGNDDIRFNAFNETIEDSQVVMYLDTTGCENTPLIVQFIERNGDLFGNDEVDFEDENGETTTELRITPSNEEVVMSFKAGSDDCNADDDPDCDFYVTVSYNGQVKANTEENSGSGGPHTLGHIKGDCNGNCGGSDWEVLSVNGILGVGDDPDFALPERGLPPNGPCAVNGVYDPNCYEFLAPIPGIGELENVKKELVDPNDPSKGYRIAISDLSAFKFEDYVNSLFSVALGLLMVLSVIMIVVAGVQYMTEESLTGKSDARKRISQALFGLVLGLSIYIILNTINPQLLQVNFASNIEKVTVNPGGGIGITLDSRPPRATGSGGDARSIDPEWAQENVTPLEFKDKNGQTILVKACDTENLETYEAFGKRITTRKELKPTVLAISQEWQAMPNRYEIKTLGGYSCRTIGTTGATATQISTHSFGITLDINYVENPYIRVIPSGGWGSINYTDMPPSFRELFISRGFGWGGNWNSIKDAMHYSKAPTNEQGDGIFPDYVKP